MPNTSALSRVLVLVVAALLDACASRHPAEVVRRFHAAEANQAVAVDADFFYAIDGAAIGKYDKRSERASLGGTTARGRSRTSIAGSSSAASSTARIRTIPRRQWSARSKCSTPIAWGTSAAFHCRRGSGRPPRVEHAHDAWWVTFANYAGRGGEPGKGPETTKLVRFDRQWQPQESWTFPAAVVQRWEGMSSSGGVWVEGKGLYTRARRARVVCARSAGIRP